MNNTITRYVLLFYILLITALNSQPLSDTEKAIFEAQDKRDVSQLIKINYDGLINLDNLRVCMLTALANIADTTYESVKIIMDIYGKEEEINYRGGDNSVQSCAAFALGQIPCASSLDFLRMIEEKESNEYAFNRTRIFMNTINALGKTGMESDLKRLCNYEFTNDSLNGALALSIARFGMRKIKNPASIEKLKQLAFYIEDEDQRQWVAYAFNRIGDKELLKDCKKELEFLATSVNPYCKMWAFSALGKTGDNSCVKYILDWYAIDTDWRVKVNMLNSLAALEVQENDLNENSFYMLLNSAVDDVNPNVCLTACSVLAKICNKLGKSSHYPAMLREYFEHYLAPGRAVEDFIQNEMIITLAKIYKDDYRQSLFSLFSQAEGYDRKSTVVSAFQYMEDPMVYRELRDTISAEVQRYNIIHPNKDGSMIGSEDLAKLYRAFVETLAALDGRMDDESRNITRLIFSEFSASKNTAITDICLSALTDSIYAKYRSETGQIMVFDFASFNKKDDKDVMLLFIETWGILKTENAEETLIKMLKSDDYDLAKSSAEALKQITGNEYIKDIAAQKYKFDFDWEFIDNLKSKKTANINTDKGKITVELFTDIAPFTVQNFVKLGEKGFYNGTVFHRVVPNFVIQGGDPTGTGYGGPGYSIRTETANNTFGAYYVGMASSGKDTEGSQFFITHSPQPHLDGKYTIFGKVNGGQEVVDRIVKGDKIIDITFSP